VQLNVQQATEVQRMAKAQQMLMEMEQCATEVVVNKRCTILNRATFLEKKY
jgi:hypothetical protein